MRLAAAAIFTLFIASGAPALAQMTTTPGPGGVAIAPGLPVPGYTPGGIGPDQRRYQAALSRCHQCRHRTVRTAAILQGFRRCHRRAADQHPLRRRPDRASRFIAAVTLAARLRPQVGLHSGGTTLPNARHLR